ncbi:UPF0235 protein C15orf40 homolog isoform X1 [Ursus maritimus]|uniref:UPF0235 protein C15orf40 homolog isoform X1 n=1 Tax=Ursus maritimus TaxID=29073 RepID=A0A8M1GSV1_URSMA|nr:UPF0235 protein C15orf40 homolog isoform X1 [Ursus arctos]XP_040498791.1 UPF0235 protein C15orf40 homolog isoform X1 [Ursus maritimus]
MLRLGRGLRQLVSGRGARTSARLPFGAEMPKKAGATNKGKSQSKEPERPLPPLGPVAVDPKGCVTIAIHAKPGSKQNAVTDVTAEAVSVAIAAPPSEGEANAELCRYLSKVLELRKSDVVLDKEPRQESSLGLPRPQPVLMAEHELCSAAFFSKPLCHTASKSAPTVPGLGFRTSPTLFHTFQCVL